MIAFDHGDAATGPEHLSEPRQGINRPGQVLQDETDEDVLEGLGGKGQVEDVPLLELHIPQPGGLGPAPGFGDGLRGDIHRREAGIRAPSSQGDRLGADAASGLQHRACGWVGGVGVQQIDQRSGLILQPFVSPG